ncbi:MAG: response regulator [Chloroflexales bacterium]
MNTFLIHLLIVDDSPEDRYTVRRLLRADPRIATITEANRGDLVLAMCQATPPDCILLDYHLPDMDGLEVLTRLRTQHDVPVVLLTGVGNEALVVDALQRGAQDYLVKGKLTPERLGLTIKRAVATVQFARERDRTLALLTATLETLQASEDRYQTLFETMTQGVVYQAADGQIIAANPAAEQILGMTLAQMQGRTSLDPRWRAIHPDGSDFPGETHPAMVALRTGQAVRHAVMGVYDWDHDTYRWIDITAVPQLRPGEDTPRQVYTMFDDITERKQAEEELRASTAQIQAISRRLVEAHERERRAIARELHDEVGQVLTGMKLTLETTMGDVPPTLRPTLESVWESITELMNRVRALSLDLRPALLDDMGLIPALTWYLDRYTPRTGVQVALRHEGVNGRFPAEVEIVVYRIIQEALTNIARYAGVAVSSVRLRADSTHLMLRVDDAGRGFDVEAVLAARTTGGLGGMYERVQLICGVLTIESAPGQGTQIIAEIPLLN